MALINTLSNPVIRGEADLFSLPPTDTTVENSFYAEYKPIVNIQDSNAKIEFRIIGNNNHYLNLNDLFLFLKIKVTDKDGKKLDATEDVSIINLSLHSLFSQIDVYFNQQLVTEGSNCYPYKSLIETILSHGTDYLNTQGTSSLFYKDTSPTNDDTNLGYKARKDIIKESNNVELCDKLRLDICHQHRYILNDTNVSIVLTRAVDEFVLMYKVKTGTTSVSPTVKILDASLFIRKVVLYPSITLAHQRIMSKGETAKYPIQRTGVKFFTIPSGNMNFIEENVFLSKIPSRIILALVKNKSFTGSYDTNPFLFEDFKISSISVLVNNIPVPIKPLSLNFAGPDCLLPYYLLFTSTGVAGEDHGLIFSREDFIKNGYTLFPFDLKPILGSESFLQLEKSGSIRVELKFSKALSEAVTLIVYSERQGMIEIDQFRQISQQ